MKNRGISLIVLIITIVVIIILATAIIVNIAQTNIIWNANEATVKQDFKTMQEELNLYMAGKFVDLKGDFKSSTFNANETTEPSVYEVVSSLEGSKYDGHVEVINGKIAIRDTLDEQVKKWALEAINAVESNEVTLKAPVDIEYVLSDNTLTLSVVVDNADEVSGVQYKFDAGNWGETYATDEEYVIDVAEKKVVYVSVRSISKDGKTASNPIQKAITFGLEDSEYFLYAGGTLDLPSELEYTVKEKTTNMSINGNVISASINATTKDRMTLETTVEAETYIFEVYVSPHISNNEYVISTGYDLEVFKNLINSGKALTQNAKLTKDIDLNVVCSDTLGSWEPIGIYDTVPYTGTFNGQNYTIKNLYINTAEDYQALFGYVIGTIKDLSVTGSVTSTSGRAAGIVSYVVDGILTNCTNYCSVTSNGSNTGGVADSVYNTTVTECVNEGKVQSAAQHTGGIIGVANSSTISMCVNKALINSTNSYVGGISGLSSNNSIITMCINTANVITSSYAAGGIVGDNAVGSSATIIYCYNIGNITANGKTGGGYTNVGGIAGYNSGSISYTYSKGTITGASSSGSGLIVGQQLSKSSAYVKYSYAITTQSYNVIGYQKTGTQTGNAKYTENAFKALTNDEIVAKLTNNFCYDENNINSGLAILTWENE